MAPQFPALFHIVSLASLGIAVACACAILIDEVRRPQKMAVMAWVWPLTALFGSFVWLAFYWRFGRGSPRAGNVGDGAREIAMPVAVAKGASHCGAGCVLGDILAETLALAVPGVVVALGWPWLFPEKMFAVWVLDFALAFVIGIAFQFFSIAPMRGLGLKEGVIAALKADTVSITAWQVGMYGGMAAIQFLWFRPLYGAFAQADAPEFWLAMQIAMLAGFCTAYPVNWLLIAVGVKERM